ncbi:Protein mono-ADP-ribosyltransferase parp4 [Bulinus truncatus]|nr:Protein mono-ADP-ribosyltransferase parp4 [Bulinus truncatus]
MLVTPHRMLTTADRMLVTACRKMVTTCRLFVTACRIDTCNSYVLKALARVSGGTFEFFNNKAKSKWETKVKHQLDKASQPGLTSVSVEWCQYDDNLRPPVQAPKQITAMFNGSRQVIYGFVPNCTMATLSANISGQQVSTVVSTSELSITEGYLVHRLTARAVIRDWEDGVLSSDRTGHENEKENLSNGPTIKDLLNQENVDILPYMSWTQGLSGDDVPIELLLEQLEEEIKNGVLSNKLADSLEDIEKFVTMKEQSSPCNKDILQNARLLVQAYKLNSDIEKAAELAVEVFNESVDKIVAVCGDRDVYPEVITHLHKFKSEIIEIPEVEKKLRPVTSLPVYGDRFVKVITLTGKSVICPISDDMTVFDLKHIIHFLMEKDAVPFDHQRLIHAGLQLNDDNILKDKNVTYGDTIHLVHRLRGGGGK